jgi:hypothetical protein
MRSTVGIGEDERLLRSISPDWIRDGRLLADKAVEVPACSFWREQFLDQPEMASTRAGRPEQTLLYFVTLRALSVPCRFEPEEEWHFVGVDLPEEGNESHCEVQTQRLTAEGLKFHRKHPKDSKKREQLRLLLAMSMEPFTK